jgi:hypothetical protein
VDEHKHEDEDGHESRAGIGAGIVSVAGACLGDTSGCLLNIDDDGSCTGQCLAYESLVGLLTIVIALGALLTIAIFAFLSLLCCRCCGCLTWNADRCCCRRKQQRPAEEDSCPPVSPIQYGISIPFPTEGGVMPGYFVPVSPPPAQSPI